MNDAALSNAPVRVTCAVIRKDDRILVTQRGAAMKMPFKWEFPGGKLEKEESEEACIIREIREELNISIRITSRMETVIHDYGKFRIELIPFLAEHLSGEVVLREHAEYRWMQLSEMAALDWAEADIPVLRQLRY